MTVHVMRVWQRLARQVVLLADELVVVQDVELLAGAHLLPTHQAGEAIQVENLVPRLPHKILRVYPLEATAALGAVSPENVVRKGRFRFIGVASMKERIMSAWVSEMPKSLHIVRSLGASLS